MDHLVIESAPAKLNLALSVGPPGPGGLHGICSWMVTVNLIDELELRVLPAGSLSRYAIMWHDQARQRTDINWPIRTDLAVRAHLAVQEHVGRDLPVQLKLEKRIPVGGGLGGGSSNAAAMLRAVNRLYELGLTTEELMSIGATLGSDVSFFIAGGSALVHGIGERIELHDETPELDVVVVLPEQSCNTAVVYQRFDEVTEGSAAVRTSDVERLRTNVSMQELSAALFNDLAEPALLTAPLLREHLQNLSKLAERPAHITGSGSSLFIICDNDIHAAALAGAIEQQLKLPAVAVRIVEALHERITR